MVKERVFHIIDVLKDRIVRNVWNAPGDLDFVVGSEITVSDTVLNGEGQGYVKNVRYTVLNKESVVYKDLHINFIYCKEVEL